MILSKSLSVIEPQFLIYKNKNNDPKGGTQTWLLIVHLFLPSFLTGIRQLQLILFKVALMLGVEIHVNVEFVKVLEPPEDQENQSTVQFAFSV